MATPVDEKAPSKTDGPGPKAIKHKRCTKCQPQPPAVRVAFCGQVLRGGRGALAATVIPCPLCELVAEQRSHACEGRVV